VELSYTKKEVLGFLFLFFLSFIIPVLLLVIHSLLGKKKENPIKNEPFECGMPSEGAKWKKYAVKFFVPATLFLIFDLEVVAFYPWAISFRQLSFYGLFLISIFFVILLFGFIYAWLSGGFEWD
jgi:NADH-quinone oxidoreductase subunit A